VLESCGQGKTISDTPLVAIRRDVEGVKPFDDAVVRNIR
jgi:hypothetical protein